MANGFYSEKFLFRIFGVKPFRIKTYRKNNLSEQKPFGEMTRRNIDLHPCSPSNLILSKLAGADWELRAAVANLTNSAKFFAFFSFNFLSNRPAQNDPQAGGQSGKRHATTVASLIISTGNDHCTQGECRLTFTIDVQYSILAFMYA